MCVYPHLYPRTPKMHLPTSHLYPCQNHLLSGSFSLSLVSVLFVGSPFRVELVESCYLPWPELLKLHMWNASMKPVLFLPYFCVESWVFLFWKTIFLASSSVSFSALCSNFLECSSILSFKAWTSEMSMGLFAEVLLSRVLCISVIYLCMIVSWVHNSISAGVEIVCSLYSLCIIIM